MKKLTKLHENALNCFNSDRFFTMEELLNNYRKNTGIQYDSIQLEQAVDSLVQKGLVKYKFKNQYKRIIKEHYYDTDSK